MSIATPSAAASRQTAGASAQELIDHRLREACSALWWAELSRGVLRMVIVWLVAVLAWVVVDQWVYSAGSAVRLAVAMGLFGWSVWWLSRHVVPLMGRRIRREYAARSLERDMPAMRQELTSYVTLEGDRDVPGLRSRVVRSIGAEAAGRLRSHDSLPEEATGTLKWWIAAAAVLALLAGYSVVSPKNTFRSAGRLLAPLASIQPARRVSIENVQPGDAEAIAGRKLAVSASVLGLNEHDEIWCRWESSDGARETELAFDEDTGRYQGELQLDYSAAGDVAYIIEAGDATAGPFHLRVQDVPVVAVQSIGYQPPSYTGEVPHTSSSASITGVDGTKVTILATTNRHVVKANIEFNPRPLGDSIRATAGATEMEIDGEGTTLSKSFSLRSAHGRSAAVQLESYRIKVWDAGGQSNPHPIIYPIRVIADLPPEVSIVMPRKSPKDVPIDAQQVIEVHALDADFGLQRVGLQIRRGIDIVAEPTLWTDAKGVKGNRVTEYRFRPAMHGLRVGDVVQITATATDNRLVENDPSIEANVSVTDPIKLRITASEPVPEDPAGGDGLSPADQRPASDANKDGDEAGQESGGGSSGDSGSSGKSQSGEGTTGEGSSGKGTSGEGNSGEGSTGEGTSGEAETGDSGTSGESGSSERGSSERGGGTEGHPSSQGTPNGSENDSPNSESSGGDPSTGQPTDQDPANGGDASNSNTGQSTQSGTPDSKGGTSSSAAAQEGATDGAAKPTPDGSTGADTPARDPGDNSSESGQTESGDSGTESSTQQGSGSASGDQSGDPSEGQQTPKHDGETFEKIRDYMEEMKQKGQSSDGGSKPEGGSKSGHEQPGSGGDPSKPDDPSGGSQAGEGLSEDASKGHSTPPGESSSETAGEPGKGGEKPSQESGGATGEQGPDGNPTGESSDGTDSSAASKPAEGSGESKSGESGTGESSETGTGETGTGESGTGETGTGESGTGETGTGETGTGETGSDASESKGGEPRPGDSSSPGTSEQASRDPSASKNQSPDQAQSPSQGGSGSGAGTDAGGAGGDAATPPDPVDVEYAKKATDMVLDYLDETRDAPDRELLDRLNWTEADLKRFAQRWKQVRELDQTGTPDPQTSRDVEDALRSLGLRPPSQATANNRGVADSLRGVRDAGNRKRAPAAYQDAFDAFRRAMGRQQ